MYSDYVSNGLWGTVNICLPAMSAFAGWQLFVRFVLQGAAPAAEPEEKE